MAAKIQHTVIFPLAEASAEQLADLQGLVARFNELPGISATFRPAGGPGGLTPQDIFARTAELKGKGKGGGKGGKGKGKMGVLEGYNHCLMVIADDVPALKGYLHGEAHKDWGPNVRPLFAGDLKPIVFDSDLLVTDVSAGKIQHTVFFKCDELTQENLVKAHDAMAEINKLPGIKASFASAGVGGMSLNDTLNALDWPDKTQGFTHVLTVWCDDVESRLGFVASQAHQELRDSIAQFDGTDWKHPFLCAIDSEWAVAL